MLYRFWYFAVARSTAQTSARKACLFLYPFQRLRKRKLNGYKKLSAYFVCTQRSLWSEWRDLNSRPYGPEPYALPNCATPRYLVAVNFDCLCNIHQFEHFCNKNKSIILKIMFSAIIFFVALIKIDCKTASGDI